MNEKQKYRELCKQESSIPIFSQDWWLDAECGETNWDVVVVEMGGEIVASLPFFKRKVFLFKLITMPPRAQTLGIWIKYPKNQGYAAKLSYEKKVFNEIIDKLPKFDLFKQNFHYSITNWLPFYWRGFKQTTRYTYVIEDLSNLDKVFSNFDHSKRKNINKAEKMVMVKFDLSAKEFYENHKMTLAKQSEKITYNFEEFERIYDGGYENNSAKTIYAVDKNENLHGALFVVWDKMSAFDLISTIDPEFRNSGAATLLIREIIKYVSQFTNKFDFEGSMIENVENSFRRFGAVQKPYFHITKTNSKLMEFAYAIKNILII